MVNAMNYATQEERDELEEIFRKIKERMAQQEKKEVEQAWKDVTRTPFIFTIIYVALVTHPEILGFIMGLLHDIAGSGNIILFVGVGLVYLIALLLYFCFYFLLPLGIIGPSIPDTEEKDGEGDEDKPKEPPKKHLPGEGKRRVFNLVTGIPLTILCYYLLVQNVSEVVAGAF